MFKYLLTFAVAVLQLGCASMRTSISGETVDSGRLGENLPIHRIKFKNGLTAILIEDHSSPTFAYQTWYKVGSRDEEKKQTGLAHLFEHMMFKGTTKFPPGQFDQLLERAGAEGLNAYTTHDFTVYIQELPKNAFSLIADLESDRMQNLIVNDQSFKTEVEVVQNERRLRKENNPDGALFQELFELSFEKHPYHWPVIGYAEDLASMNARDAEKFYKKHYRPENATVVVSGDLSLNEFVSTLKSKYGAIEESKEKPSPLYTPEPVQIKARKKRVGLPIQVQKLMMGYKTIPLVSEEAAALRVFESILSDGKSSRLNRALVESGMASYAGAFQMDNLDRGLLIISVGAQKGKTANHCEKLVLNTLEEIKKHGVSDPEIKRAKNKILFSFYSGLDSNSSRAEFVGKFQLASGRYESGLELLKQIESVTSEDIQKLVQKYFQPEMRTTIVGVKQ